MVWWLVGVGGAIGSVARHALNQFIQHQNVPGTFPLGIFTINVLGSAVIGVIAGVVTSGRWNVSMDMRTFLMVGLIGGFTTFSSFSLDTLTLIREGALAQAAWNVVGQVSLSLIAVWLGFTLGAKL